MVLPNYSTTGEKNSNLKVSEDIFNIENVNHTLLKQAYEYYLNKRRANLAYTKTRSAVRGGGRKPHKQKGTGKARAGTIRSPLWRGGGVTFGPTGLENYQQKMNKKAKIIAVRHALSLNQKQLITMKSLPNDGKTATVSNLLFKTLNLSRKVLLIDTQIEDKTKIAIRNLQNVNIIDINYLNVYQILNNDWLIITEKALEVLEDKLGSLKKN